MRRFFHLPPRQHPAHPGTPKLPAEPTGTTIQHRYLIEAYLAGGGFSYIYRVRDMHLGLPRALKAAVYTDPASRRQFAEEAELLINCHHPNLVRGYSHFTDGIKQYLVMELINGPTVEDVAIDYIKAWRRAPECTTVLNWMIPICDAVYTLNRQPVPVIHRDVKPANIQIEQGTSRPVLIDLGLAKRFLPGHTTQAAALAFTPGYAPPEQYQASGATDQRTDVYALGATLFFLLTGYQPVEAPARLTGTPQPAPSARNPSLTPAFDSVVLRAMALDPRERYSSAAELRVALSTLRANLSELQPTAGYASGGPLPGRTCDTCHTQNPGIALFCFQCGGAFGARAALDESDPAVPVPSPVLPIHSDEPTVPLLPDDAPHLSVPPVTNGVAADLDPSDEESRATVLAMLALVSIAVGLLSFATPVMLLATVVGLGLAHHLAGVRIFSVLLGWRLAWRTYQSPLLRRLRWPAAPVVPELRHAVGFTLVAGYLSLVAEIAFRALPR